MRSCRVSGGLVSGIVQNGGDYDIYLNAHVNDYTLQDSTRLDPNTGELGIVITHNYFSQGSEPALGWEYSQPEQITLRVDADLHGLGHDVKSVYTRRVKADGTTEARVLIGTFKSVYEVTLTLQPAEIVLLEVVPAFLAPVATIAP
jgi:hypothetical protein